MRGGVLVFYHVREWCCGREQGDRYVSAFRDAHDRFAIMREGLQRRTADDRAFIKSWKKEAAQRAREAATSHRIETTVELATSESSDLEEIFTSDDEESPSETPHLIKRSKLSLKASDA